MKLPWNHWAIEGTFSSHFLCCCSIPGLLADRYSDFVIMLADRYTIRNMTFAFLFFQDTIQLLITVMLLADLFVTLLMLFLFYWISLGAFLAVLLILPLSLLSPFPAGLNALFTNGPKRASLARVYALWNASSISNIVSYTRHLNEHLTVSVSTKQIN